MLECFCGAALCLTRTLTLLQNSSLRQLTLCVAPEWIGSNGVLSSFSFLSLFQLLLLGVHNDRLASRPIYPLQDTFHSAVHSMLLPTVRG